MIELQCTLSEIQVAMKEKNAVFFLCYRSGTWASRKYLLGQVEI